MSNPCNNSNLCGRVISQPTFFSAKDGTEFSCAFTLAVTRNYKNGGEYLSDYIPVRYEGEKRMNFAHTLGIGDSINIAGAIKTENYVGKDGKKVYSIYVAAENIARSPETTKKNENTDMPLPM